ncbi:esterase E4-like [Pectinophora gossypiella]|uniref:esterase E4-like n=1 Tax=Pectinophora gossypiella TaxID=13191 RepID=UPI00214E7124|nr:esterase E4-like [Pectinophora gossypiella]
MYQLKIFLCILLFFNTQYIKGTILSQNTRITDDLIVETKVGKIRGVRGQDDDFTSFMGIPYAKVDPENIFGNSLPYPNFEDIFEANNDSAICPQIEEFEFQTVGTLDCLHLNIYVPKSAATEHPLPVMVYIYGGGFSIGFAGRFLYGPKFIVRHDVILVVLNYRLGPYGFMCLNTPEIPGNQGLKDQVAALRWVKNNIIAFGGDPNKVTLFGNSAGAMSAGLHLISDIEDNLFNNVIMQSGSAFFSGLGKTGKVDTVLKLADAVGLTTDDINYALAHLSQLSKDEENVHRIIEAAVSLGVSNFAPCLEKEFNGVERYLSKMAINSNHSKATNIGILLGYNKDELLVLFGENANTDNWDQMYAGLLSSTFNFETDKLTELAGIVRRFYIGDEEINIQVRHQMSDFYGDMAFVYPIIRSIKRFHDANVDKVYQYLFSYDGGRNFVKLKDGITEPGVLHADEIGYLFDMEFIPYEITEADQLIIDRMTTMWTNFAKFGDPTPNNEVDSDILPIKWEPVTKESPYYFLNIDTVMSLERRFQSQRMSFWELFFTAYEKYEIGYIDPNPDKKDDGEPDGASTTFLSPVLVLTIIFSIFYR